MICQKKKLNITKKNAETQKKMQTKNKEKAYKSSRIGNYTFCIGVFWLCTGNDRLDVISLRGVNARLCSLLCRRTRLYTMDDNGGIVLSRPKTQRDGYSCTSQLDGELCGWHWFPQYEGRVKYIYIYILHKYAFTYILYKFPQNTG